MAPLESRIVGHLKVREQLRKLSQRDQLPPSLILSGPEGVGKKAVALAWLQNMLCLRRKPESPLACGQCSSCLQVSTETHPALLWMRPEKRLIKLEQAKAMAKRLHLLYSEGPRFAIVEDAHLMNPQAGNSLLKIVEEPPENTTFLFMTSSYLSLLPTLRSRSQRINFHALSLRELKSLTGAEGWELRSAQGSVSRLQEFLDADAAQLKDVALAFFKEIFGEKYWSDVIASFKDTVKDRESLIFVFQIWKQILRDSFQTEASLRIHQDQDFRWLTDEIPGEKRLQVFDQISRFEKGIKSNWDSQLSVESLLLQIRDSDLESQSNLSR